MGKWFPSRGQTGQGSCSMAISKGAWYCALPPATICQLPDNVAMLAPRGLELEASKCDLTVA